MVEKMLRNARDYLVANKESWIRRIPSLPRDIAEVFQFSTAQLRDDFAESLLKSEQSCREDLHAELAIEINDGAALLNVSEEAVIAEFIRLINLDLAKKLPLSPISKEDSFYSSDGVLSSKEIRDYVAQRAISCWINIEKPGQFVGKSAGHIKRFNSLYKVDIRLQGGRTAPRKCLIEAQSVSDLAHLFKDPHFKSSALWEQGLNAKRRSDTGPFKFFKVNTDAEIAATINALTSSNPEL